MSIWLPNPPKSHKWPQPADLLWTACGRTRPKAAPVLCVRFNNGLGALGGLGLLNPQTTESSPYW
jgi:hypothetical protein